MKKNKFKLHNYNNDDTVCFYIFNTIISKKAKEGKREAK
jgi:hypothetical protein